MTQADRVASPGYAAVADRNRLHRLEQVLEALLENGLDVVVDGTDTVARLASTTDQSGFTLGSTCHLSGENALAYLESATRREWRECASRRQLVDRECPQH
jgi:hypothetical protein